MSDNDLEIRITAQIGELQSAFTEVVNSVKSLTGAFEGMNAASEGAAGAMEGLSAASQAMVATQSSLVASQNAFMNSLKTAADTVGMTSSEIRRYQADMLGLKDAAESEIQTIEHGEAARQDYLRSTQLAAAETRKLSQAFEDAHRMNIAFDLKATADAARAYAAAIAEAERMNAAFDESQAAFIAGLERQIVGLRGGATALLEYDAAAKGLSAEAAPLIKTIADLNAENARLSGTTRSAAAGITEMGHAAGGSRGALYELMVVSHELTSGRFRQALSSSTILLQKLAVPVGFAVSFAIGAALALSMARNIGATVQKYEDLHNASVRLGVDTATLQVLGFASDQLGIKTDALTAGMARMDNAFARARMGAKQQQDAFAALKVPLDQNYTSGQLLQKVLEHWGDVDGPRKVTLATELFGKAGVALIPVLNSLAGNYDNLKARAEEYGLVNDTAVAKGVAIAAQFRDVQAAFQGLGNTLLAVSGDGVVNFLNSVSAAVVNLRKFIAEANTPGTQLNNTFRMIGSAANLLAVAIGSTAVAAIAGFAAETLVGAQALGLFNAAIRLAALGDFEAAIAEAGMGFFAFTVGVEAATTAVLAFTTALLLNPVTWIAVGIGVAVLAYEHMKQAAYDAAEGVRSLADAHKTLSQEIGVAGKRTQEEIDQNIQLVKTQAQAADITVKLALAKVHDTEATIASMSANERASVRIKQLNADLAAQKIILGQDAQALAALAAEWMKLGNEKPIPMTTAGDPTKGVKQKAEKDDLEKNLQDQLLANKAYGDAVVTETTKYWNDILAAHQSGSAKDIEIDKTAQAKLYDLWKTAHGKILAEQVAAANQTFEIAKRNADETLAVALSGDEDQIDQIKKLVGAKNLTQSQGLAATKAILSQELQSQLDNLATIRAAQVAQYNADMVAAKDDAAKQAELTRKDALDQIDYDNQVTNLKLANKKKQDDATATADAKESEAADAILHKWTETYDKIGESWAKNIQGIIQGTKSWQQIWNSTLSSMLGGMLGFVARVIATWAAQETAKTVLSTQGTAMRAALENGWLGKILTMGGINVAAWLKDETGKTAATAAGVTARASAETTANAAGATTMLAQTMLEIKQFAGRTFGGIFAALSSNPATLPAAAPVAAAGMASVLGVAVSEQGFGEVPYDNMPALLHKQETVLPASIATPLRSMLASYNPANGNAPAAANDGGGGGEAHLHIHGAMDGADVLRVLRNNKDHVQTVLGEMMRAGKGGAMGIAGK